MTFGIKIKKPLKPTHNAPMTREDMKALCIDKDSAMSRMLSDKTMVRHIKNGNASDKGLKRDAEIIQREVHEKRQQELKQGRLDKIAAAKEKYRRRYGVDPV